MQSSRKNLFVDIDIDTDLNALVDERMIGRVASNLIHNAIKFTDDGGITISAQRCNGADDKKSKILDMNWVTVSVCDTGVGIAPEEMGRIFERFYKVDRARDRQEAGTGLGLAIARYIVEAHGGKIWTEQNREGAKFCFTVPAE
jgi:two-component system phosphate regulon sensor histidine kinase PhoR